VRRPALTPRLVALGAALVVVTTVAVFALAQIMQPRTSIAVDAVALSEKEFAFSPQPLVVPARTAVSIAFRNLTAAPHTLIILAPISAGSDQSVPAHGTSRIEFVTPDPGTYGFVCNVHEGMTGTMVVQ
jgi:plastocyanin